MKLSSVDVYRAEVPDSTDKLKDGHFWAYVWNEDKGTKYKKIVTQTYLKDCEAVLTGYENEYFTGMYYETYFWQNYEKIEQDIIINPEYRCYSLCSKETQRLLREQIGKGTLERWCFFGRRWNDFSENVDKLDIMFTYRAIIKAKTPMDIFMEKFKGKKITLNQWATDEHIEVITHDDDDKLYGRNECGHEGLWYYNEDWKLWENKNIINSLKESAMLGVGR